MILNNKKWLITSLLKAKRIIISMGADPMSLEDLFLRIFPIPMSAQPRPSRGNFRRPRPSSQCNPQPVSSQVIINTLARLLTFSSVLGPMECQFDLQVGRLAYFILYLEFALLRILSGYTFHFPGLSVGFRGAAWPLSLLLGPRLKWGTPFCSFAITLLTVTSFRRLQPYCDELP